MSQPTANSRSITAAGLTLLLARLHPDPEQSPLEYERLRRTLVRFFDWRGAYPPDECADDALDRLARRLEDSTDVVDVRHYAYGIARLVLLERRRQPSSSPLDEVPDLARVPGPASPDDREVLHACFDRCLAELPDESRSLVVRYYDGERQVKIANRRQLAAALGVSENALRSRVQRLRDRLEQCISECASRQGAR